MTKTYQLINGTTLRTCVSIDGRATSIRFAGGMYSSDGRIVRAGTYTTSDEKMQKAIEADTMYGKSFTLVCQDNNDTPTPNDDGNDDRQKVEGVTNTQMAIEWLKTNKEVQFDGVPKKADVLVKAAEQNVVFVDWK